MAKNGRSWDRRALILLYALMRIGDRWLHEIITYNLINDGLTIINTLIVAKGKLGIVAENSTIWNALLYLLRMEGIYLSTTELEKLNNKRFIWQ
jgi:hypothetical protein